MHPKVDPQERSESLLLGFGDLGLVKGSGFSGPKKHSMGRMFGVYSVIQAFHETLVL